ncbi:CIA30 family protein [Rubricoccus marinus]|uniref:NADH:ubiquinone oxidoreductase intermediate-associated protein 30 domain-containing protein n=1 Tax=Rubricoccus marinus TaxID=716817 RepID=A0A259TYW4_9BACT|nr:CIA30 family protein [Rubricoccus marinus]OZC02963.1 hypothetical protein BSZ36_08260 [Rubricoccus marinus]
MRVLFVALLLAACASDPASGAPEALPPAPMTLFDFDAPDAPTWTVEDDTVMGGHSNGRVEVSGGTLRFTGTLVTRDGGFSQTRAQRRLDLSEYSAVELRVRGGGRTFQVEVHDGAQIDGKDVARRGDFPTTEDWQTVRVPFSSLGATVHGEPVEAEPLALDAVESVALYIADGQDGPFELEVDWIRAAE